MWGNAGSSSGVIPTHTRLSQDVLSWQGATRVTQPSSWLCTEPLQECHHVPGSVVQPFLELWQGLCHDHCPGEALQCPAFLCGMNLFLIYNISIKILFKKVEQEQFAWLSCGVSPGWGQHPPLLPCWDPGEPEKWPGCAQHPSLQIPGPGLPP